MTHRTVRSLGGVLLAVSGAVLLVLAVMIMSTSGVGKNTTALMMDGAPNQRPDPGYAANTDQLYLVHSHTDLWSPSLAGDAEDPWQIGPETDIHDRTFDTSGAHGVADLNTTIKSELAAGNNVVVFGYSQGASIVASYFDTASDQRPSPGLPSFLLTGDPNGVEGRAADRLDGLYTPLLDEKFGSAVPDNVYTTVDGALGYDGAADLPQHPLDAPANLEAIAGIYYLHPTSPQPTVNDPVISSDVSTTYIVVPTENLPLLEPLRGVVPAALLDPGPSPLKVVVELGYDRVGSQVGPNPAGSAPRINLITAITGLDRATTQGVNDALVDAGLPTLPDIPSMDSAPTDLPLTDGAPVDRPATAPSILAAEELPDANAITLPPSILGQGDSSIPPDSEDGFLPGLSGYDVFLSGDDSPWESILSDLPGGLVWPQSTDLDLGPGWPVDPNQPPSTLDFTG